MNAFSPELDAALALWRQGQAGPALASVQQAIKLDPSQPKPWEMAGYFLVNRKKWAEARQLLSIAVNLHPDHALLRSYYAIALAKTGETEFAYEQVSRALRLQPDMPEALLARIEILCDAGYYDLASQDSARLPERDMPETAAFCQGSTAFLTGDTTRGMRLLASVIKSGWRGKDLPEWNGEAARDKHVVLYNGQAFGDLIQFIRYVGIARQRAGKITLQAPRNFMRLIRDSFPDLALDEAENLSNLQEDVSLRCALSSLANFGEGGFDPLADKVPYLHANPELAAAWRERLAHLPRPRIGLVWTSPWQMNNPFRVVDFAALKPLVDVAGRHLVSLQMGPEAKQAAEAGLFDASPLIGDFADSAALMSELDLIITLDSAPAHLAGALGKPAWVFLPFNAEWRWLVGREDCIWYPTMRLFRQSRPQDWPEVFRNISSDAQSFLSGDACVLQPATWDGVALRRHPHALPLPGLAEIPSPLTKEG
jgi:hypothetical protein